MNVDIQVEIGTPEQQEVIKAELQMVLSWMGDEFIDSIDLHQIIIPVDFDALVNRLLNITWYTSDRIQRCIGKVIESEGKNYILMSYIMYTDFMTFGKRCHFIMHELHHLVNRKQFTIPEFAGTSTSRYTNLISIMFDEYNANLRANDLMLKICDYELFGDFKEQLIAEYNGFLSSIKGENHYYIEIKKAYEDLHQDGDVQKMLRDIYIFIDAAIKDLAYCYSIADVFNAVKEDFQQQESVFLNSDTENLFNLFRKWTASHEEIDFEEGLDAAESFMATCFGIAFYEGPKGERLDLVPF
jgi:hypothetical protein